MEAFGAGCGKRRHNPERYRTTPKVHRIRRHLKQGHGGQQPAYARIHQLGGTVRPQKGKFLKFRGLDGEDVFAKEVTIPARPYLGISDDDREEIVATMTDFLEGAFK